MSHDVDGTRNLHGPTEARRWANGWEDDSNHDNVQTDKAQNGGICVPESLHSFKSRWVDEIFYHLLALSLSNLDIDPFTEVELENIQERYVQVLRSYLQHTQPHNPGRLGDLLAHIPEVSFTDSPLGIQVH